MAVHPALRGTHRRDKETKRRGIIFVIFLGLGEGGGRGSSDV